MSGHDQTQRMINESQNTRNPIQAGQSLECQHLSDRHHACLRILDVKFFKAKWRVSGNVEAVHYCILALPQQCESFHAAQIKISSRQGLIVRGK